MSNIDNLHKSGEQASHWQGGPVEKICQYCGKSYMVGKARVNKSHYCSNGCTAKANNSGNKSYMWRGGNVGMVCPCCRKSFVVHRGDKRRKYCSTSCLDEARRKRVNLICHVCGKQYTEKLSKANRYEHSFCSFNCQSIFHIGENSPSWQGGKSFEPYPITFNDKFKRMIRNRDNHICKICGKKGKDVHHINYVKDDTFPYNCITLCRSCHTRTNSNREYWQQYFSL